MTTEKHRARARWASFKPTDRTAEFEAYIGSDTRDRQKKDPKAFRLNRPGLPETPLPEIRDRLAET